MSDSSQSSARRTIVSPALDVWLFGGASIIALSLLCASSLFISSDLVLEKFLLLTVALNGTHFLASYRLLYSSWQFARAYPWASMYMPVLLVVYALGALVALAIDPAMTLPARILIGAASIYLALHYTGQTWGMMASFAYLDGVRFTPRQKLTLRASLKVMAVWHAIWALRLLWTPDGNALAYLDLSSRLMNYAGLLSMLAGLAALWSIGGAGGRRVTSRVAVPYVALYVWYFFLFLNPGALFWVQMFHAIQYLPFPMRVELNRLSIYGAHAAVPRPAKALLTYGAVLVAASTFVFGGIPWLAREMGAGANSVWVVIASVINIHHYFIDGCIWRISNPVVSKELFAHTDMTPSS
jgi:hypothetical protein